jgi:hypothetical protein
VDAPPDPLGLDGEPPAGQVVATYLHGVPGTMAGGQQLMGPDR